MFIYVGIASILYIILFFFFKQKTAYEMRISDWSSDVCSSDPHLAEFRRDEPAEIGSRQRRGRIVERPVEERLIEDGQQRQHHQHHGDRGDAPLDDQVAVEVRADEHKSELQALMRI